MGRDVTFYGQWAVNREQQAAWRARRVGVTALRGWKAPFGGRLDGFVVGAFLDRLEPNAAIDVTSRSVRIAGVLEAGTFWETVGRELAGILVVCAKHGYRGWVVIEDDDRCFRLESDGTDASYTEPSAAALRRARRSPAHGLLDTLRFGLSETQAAEVEAAADAAIFGTAVEHVARGDVEDVFAIVQDASDKEVKRALATADDVPSKGTLVQAKRLLKTKEALLDAARSAKRVEHRAAAIDVASHLDAERCAARCLPWLTKKKVPAGLRAAAVRALGRAGSDAALEGLLGLVYAKATDQTRNDPVHAALLALEKSPHPHAADRMLAALPELKGRRGDESFARAAFVVAARRARHLSAHYEAIAADGKHRNKYTAQVVVDCLRQGKGETGNLLALCFSR